MNQSAPATARQRVRAELTEQIKLTARRHMAENGAPSLSLRAVARELGMASSALYRYFPSRDALLTALIIDAYNALGASAELANAECAPGDLAGRWMSVCVTVRQWATNNPHEYGLIFGSPVPGYAAPIDTTDPASRVSLVYLSILGDAVEAGATSSTESVAPPEMDDDIERLLAFGSTTVPAPMMMDGLAAWTQVFGMISFELFGHYNTLITDYDAHFRQQCTNLARHLGLNPPQTDFGC